MLVLLAVEVDAQGLLTHDWSDTAKSKIVQGSTICNFDSPYGYTVRSAVKCGLDAALKSQMR